jgi:hypothetical protein
LINDTPDACAAQPSNTPNRPHQFFPRLSLSGALLLILCFSLIALSIALFVAWSPSLTHLVPSVAVVPHPWGCNGGPMPC